MPIKDKSIYPSNWKAFSKEFREKHPRCQRCRVPNHSFILRGYADADKKGALLWTDLSNGEAGDAENGDSHGYLRQSEMFFEVGKAITIVLTVAHLNHDDGPCDCLERTGKLCANPNHVEALCQRCHLRLDGPRHIEAAKATRAIKNDAQRGLLNF